MTEKLLSDGVTLLCTAFDNILATTQRMMTARAMKRPQQLNLPYHGETCE